MPHELFDKMTTVGVRAIRDGQVKAESQPGERGRWGGPSFRTWMATPTSWRTWTAEDADVMGERHTSPQLDGL
jgi:hypothetical protein